MSEIVMLSTVAGVLGLLTWFMFSTISGIRHELLSNLAEINTPGFQISDDSVTSKSGLDVQSVVIICGLCVGVKKRDQNERNCDVEYRCGCFGVAYMVYV